MTAASRIEEARAAWARGDGRRAIALGWDAVNNAMDHGIDGILTQTGDLARTIAATADGKVARDARQLADYCHHCLAGVGTGTQAPNLWGMISSWRRRKCPDCAEPIARDARVCPHCGYRIKPPPTE